MPFLWTFALLPHFRFPSPDLGVKRFCKCCLTNNTTNHFYHLPNACGLAQPPQALLFCGSLAQMVEHLIFNQGVAGSSPARPTSKNKRRK